MQTCVQYSLIVINYCTVGKAVKVTKKIKNINHTYVFVAVFCKAFLDYRQQCFGSGSGSGFKGVLDPDPDSESGSGSRAF